MINQQKVYIDVDEEITTVIDRIYHTKGNDIALIVPQHALLLQSVVNLKLLAQEAKKYKKNIILMTRDEDGITFAKRAGITIQPFIAKEDENEIETSASVVRTEQKPIPMYAKKIIEEEVQQRTNMDLGSKSFFDKNSTRGINVSGVHASQSIVSSDVVGKDAPMHKQKIQRKQNMRDNDNKQQYRLEKQFIQKNTISPQIQKEYQARHNVQNQNTKTEHLDEYEQSLRQAQLSNGGIGDTYLQQNKQSQRKYTQIKKTQKHNNVALSSMSGTIVKSFIFGGIALIVLVFIIIVLPKTKISVSPKHIHIDEKMELTAQADQGVYDSERRLLPLRIIERDITFTKTFDATGSGDVKAQKAQGEITIFNEYNDKPQPLVATTRFLAEDGTLFRLVNQVVVPGMKNGEAGKVEALVVADKEGDGGNIGPTKFSIPGFESSPKKDKFHAVSEKTMTGGGVGGNGVVVVTETDIEKAKKEMTDESKQYIIDQITGLLRPNNEVLIDEDITYDVVRSEANVSAGTMTEQFMYEIVFHTKTLVFSEDDVLAIMESNLTQKYHQYNADQVNIQMKYENVVSNFDKESIKMTAHGKADVIATVDLISFKKNIIGKKHEELFKIIENDYDDEIEKITIENVFPRFPAFISNRISKFGFMTEIFVK